MKEFFFVIAVLLKKGEERGGRKKFLDGPSANGDKKSFPLIKCQSVSNCMEGNFLKYRKWLSFRLCQH
jgi:hypothetical protein